MNIKLVKLITGEEFITEVTADSKEYLFCKNAVKLMTTQQGLAMVPFNPLIPEQNIVQYKHEHIIFCVDIEEEFANSYKQAFGGILTNSKLIV